MGQETKTIKNLNAIEGLVYFDLDKGVQTNATDPNWDIAFHKTNIQLNSEKGNVSGQILSGSSFDEVKKAPTAGFVKDGKQAAVPGGSGNGWYIYNMEDHTIQPISDRVILVKTSDKKTVKISILSYYKDMAEHNPGGYYNFTYAFLP